MKSKNQTNRFQSDYSSTNAKRANQDLSILRLKLKANVVNSDGSPGVLSSGTSKTEFESISVTD